MRHSRFLFLSLRLLSLAALAVLVSQIAHEPSAAQPGGGMPPAPVRTTEAIRHDIQQRLTLTGNVQSRGASVVASEIAGIVDRLDAREGDPVRRGAPLARLRSDNLSHRLEAARGELAEADARQRLAEMARSRAGRMFEEGVISREVLDDAIAQSEATRGRVAQLTADVGRLRDDLAKSVIRSPFDGVVVRELTAPGQWVAAGGDVAELIDTGDLEITLDVPSQHFPRVRRNAKVHLRVGEGGESMTGSVRAIVPRADPRARTFPVKISLPNRDGRVAVGMLAEVELSLGGAEGAILVPKDAVVTEGPQRLVYVVGVDNTVQPVPVTTSSSQGAWIAVSGDLNAGDRVVTRGNERLRPGQTVQPQPLSYPLP
ncbi:MAG TPA: efflux RND transporter periplasmic adaptor subunit [Thermoanaerobaculia bacterium]|nr:efflux RND transporter periplasmic adaptor subunit [Thermoanaerobaculia bacterium]